jgi:carboxyl-terminal processing protease
MKTIFLLMIVIFCSIANVFSQIQNPSFEVKKSPESMLPSDWNVGAVTGFSATLVDDEKCTGQYSMRISSTEQTSNYLNITQRVPVSFTGLKRIKITTHIKTKDLKGSAAIWCQMWDKDKKQIGFENSGSQAQLIGGTTDWKKYTLTLMVDEKVKDLYFGVYAQGAGTAWFDDFAIEEVQGSNEPATAEVMKYSEEFNAIVKRNSIYTDSLNWPAIEADLKVLSAGLKTTEDAKVLTSYVLSKLRKAGDNHSFMQNKSNAESYASKNTSPDTVIAKLLPNNIGYISIPSYGSINKEVGEQFAQHIQDLIKKLDIDNKIKGWVVDLRRNGGGNMHPMIAGLHPLIGKGPIGYFVKGQQKNEWGYSVKINQEYTLKNPSNNIAVLIGPRTASSGEMTAITFIGKNNTKFFGEPSGGYVTANSMHLLSDGAKLLLASSYSADRNGKKYLDRLYPDVVAKYVDGKDVALQMAEEWLLVK